ncbi:hypothetical protein MNBD_GAMMA10-250 [hydrothermal vent metagenome]|uniref:HMA domain-containing protein n=1 Tax=hydrothermal vent metagenome TaxID=652676 RepID=A0A3B0XH61_9ZZZZ
MKKLIRTGLASILLSLSFAQSSFGETTRYSIRVDGLACPYCAYGIEKKLNEIKGVKFIDMNLDKGIVSVEATDVVLQDPQLKQLFQDAGFTYRSKQQAPTSKIPVSKTPE